MARVAKGVTWPPFRRRCGIPTSESRHSAETELINLVVTGSGRPGETAHDQRIDRECFGVLLSARSGRRRFAPNEAVVVLDDDHVGVLSRIIHDHAPPGLTITERNLAEEIDQVVTRTLAQTWDNADARNRGVRRATAAVFRRYMLKPVGEPYDSTVAYIEAHYLVD
ncbi:hypothetical protein Vqi01_12580 [Micromonospora qiuiae]|uniref:Uncharacterized protein n=1 Tax=Micromonospora qiuiae TaxID=502268 RepID=A0ABQ4J7G4_9ACTN|nr:hypothetical protein [Micromonospora qiuiae]GIJ26096.1 hypothetical protein Vqi01_12580 [Micromonospora qiuiae]